MSAELECADNATAPESRKGGGRGTAEGTAPCGSGAERRRTHLQRRARRRADRREAAQRRLFRQSPDLVEEH